MAFTVTILNTEAPSYTGSDKNPQTLPLVSLKKELEDFFNGQPSDPGPKTNDKGRILVTITEKGKVPADKVYVNFTVESVDKKEVKVKVGDLEEVKPAVEDPPRTDILAGANSLLGDGAHFGVTVTLLSGTKTSVLTIPDVSKVKGGGGDVFITKPLNLKLEKLRNFLKKKEIQLPDAVDRLLSSTTLSCDALFFRTPKDGKGQIMLLSISIDFSKGLISSLTGDPDLGELFDVQGAALRVFQCSKEDLKVLQDYAAQLRGEEVPAEPEQKALPAGKEKEEKPPAG